MKKEVLSAANFLVDLLRLNGSGGPLSEDQLKVFKENVCECLWIHYRDHWFPDRPEKGSGYRCIRINGTMDPLIARAIAPMGINNKDFRKLFPQELTMWVDPKEVAYRIGENGSICNIVTATSTTRLKEQLSSAASTAESLPKGRHPQSTVPSTQTDSSTQKLKQYLPSASPPPSVQLRPPQHPSPPSSPPSSEHLRDQQLTYQQQQLAMFLLNGTHGTVNNCKDVLRPPLDTGRAMERLFVTS